MSELEASGLYEWEARQMVRETYLFPPPEAALKAKLEPRASGERGGEDVQRDRERQERSSDRR